MDNFMKAKLLGITLPNSGCDTLEEDITLIYLLLMATYCNGIIISDKLNNMK